MKVLEFVLDTSGKYAVDSFSDEENMIVYTGTHDNSTRWNGIRSSVFRPEERYAVS